MKLLLDGHLPGRDPSQEAVTGSHGGPWRAGGSHSPSGTSPGLKREFGAVKHSPDVVIWCPPASEFLLFIPCVSSVCWLG